MKRRPVADQPIVRDGERIARFQANRLVVHLLDFATPRGCGLNELATVEATPAEREQLAQLIGYSVSGYGDLSYVRRASVRRADRRVAATRKGSK